MTIKRRVFALAFASFALLAAGQMPADTLISPEAVASEGTDLTAADLAAIDARTAQLRAAAVPLTPPATEVSIENEVRAPDFTVDDSAAAPVRLTKLVATSEGAELNDELKCLATAVYFEARGEPLEGQLAVAQVILNRVESGRFAPTVCGVVYQPGQFTFAHNRAPATNSTDWKVAQAIAVIAANDTYRDVAPRAISFHAKRLAPNWSNMKRVSQIGNHVFYR
jgi:spore germination cell wall hydrolase CwlJ-like protein